MTLTEFWNKKPLWNLDDGGTPGGDPKPDPDPSAGPTPDATPATPDFSWAGEDFTKDGQFDMDGFKAHHQELLTQKTLADERAAAVPEDGNYQFALPEDLDFGDLKLPEGMKIEIDTESEAFKPLFGEFGAILKEHGLPQEAATKMMGLLGKMEAAKASQAHAQLTENWEKLGPNDAARQARMAQVQRSLETKLPAEQAKALQGVAGNIQAVQAIEALLKGAGGMSPPTKTTSAPSKASDLDAYYSNPT